MADFRFDNPEFDVGDVDEDSPFLGRFDDVGAVDTTVDSELPTGRSAISLHQELIQEAVDAYYDALAKEGLAPSLGRDTAKFELVEGRLRLKAYPDIAIVSSRTGRPNLLSTIGGKVGGGDAIRQDLGFADWTRARGSMSARAVVSLQRTNEELGSISGALTTTSVELKDLGAAAQVAKRASDVVETTLSDVDIDRALETMGDPPLNIRELRGLDRVLQTIRGELTNNLAKLSGLDEQITKEKTKLGEADDEFSKRRVAERLRGLEDERAARMEAASASREALRTQISRIRETIGRVLSDDTTLGERIRTLFREQGITIASILTAIGMAITTMVVALGEGGAAAGSGGAAAGSGTSPAPSGKGDGLKEWVKRHLQSLGRILGKLASKAAGVLPGIIGSVVSWLLSIVAKTAGWLAENMWAMVIAVGSLLFIGAREWLMVNSRKDPDSK
jgi:hypothetical protein